MIKKHISFWLVVIIGIALLMPLSALASDITGAHFTGIINTTNNGTAASNVCVPITGMNTTAHIAGGFLNATATNYAIQNTSSADLKSMPGWDTNPWILFHSALGAYSITNSIFFSKDATGYTPSWFPGTAGGTVPDDASLEFANDGSAELDGYYDPASSGYLLKKEAAYQAYGNGSGNVTWEIAHSSTNTTAAIRPNAAGTHTAINAEQPGGSNHYTVCGDNNDATYVYTSSGAYLKDTYNIPNHTTEDDAIASVTIYFRIEHSVANITYAKPLFLTNATLYEGTEQSTSGAVWVTKSEVFATNPVTGNAWTWDEIDALEIGVELKSNNPGSSFARCADVWIIVTYHPWVGIESDVIAEGEHTFYPAYLNPFIVLGIDDTTVPVTDNITLNLPLWQEECSTSPFTSIDSNAVACTTVNGPVWTNQGYTFDGTDDYIDCGNNTATDIIGDEITIEILVYTNTIADAEWQHFISKGNDDQYQMRMTPGSGVVFFELTTTSGRVTMSCTAGNAMLPGVWYLWTGTYDGAHMRLYRNGVEAGTAAAQTGTIVSSGDTMKLGVRDGGYGELDGGIMMVIIRDICLTPAEIAQNHDAFLSLYTTADDVFVYSYAGGVTDNANDIYFCTDDIMLYVDSLSMYVSGALVDTWVWQYAATFTGDTTGNILTPSFRTASSDADVSAELVSFSPISEPIAPAFAIGAGPDFMTDNITTGNSTGAIGGGDILDFPGKDILDSVAGTTPRQFVFILIASFLLLAVSLLVSYFLKESGASSIFIKSVANIIIYAVLIALHIFDWWMLIFFFIFEQSVWFAAKERRE